MIEDVLIIFCPCNLPSFLYCPTIQCLSGEWMAAWFEDSS